MSRFKKTAAMAWLIVGTLVSISIGTAAGVSVMGPRLRQWRSGSLQ
ncbi:hypothetical protein [Methylobacter psychrophilus]|nr:hypothetical protein [Methylobacter psychrophilus]